MTSLDLRDKLDVPRSEGDFSLRTEHREIVIGLQGKKPWVQLYRRGSRLHPDGPGRDLARTELASIVIAWDCGNLKVDELAATILSIAGLNPDTKWDSLHVNMTIRRTEDE